MSAKWRRSRRNSKRFDILKAFRRIKDKRFPQKSLVKNLKPRKRVYSYKYRVPGAHAERRMREPEPLIDVLEAKDDVIVVAEFVGFSRENLRIHVKNQRLTLSAESSNRKYYKSLNLPKRVIPNTMRATCKNGVLEVLFKKMAEEKTIGKVAE